MAHGNHPHSGEADKQDQERREIMCFTHRIQSHGIHAFSYLTLRTRYIFSTLSYCYLIDADGMHGS